MDAKQPSRQPPGSASGRRAGIGARDRGVQSRLPVSASGSTGPGRAIVGCDRSHAADLRYPCPSPEGSESLDDGRSRSSSLEDALSHHPTPADTTAEIPAALPEVPGV